MSFFMSMYWLFLYLKSDISVLGERRYWVDVVNPPPEIC